MTFDETKADRKGDEVVLRNKPDDLLKAFELLAGMPDDLFPNGRERPLVEKRERLERIFE